jgi:hypothetical protein
MPQKVNRLKLSSMSKTVNKSSGKSDSHSWSFSRVGGVNRVNLETGEDLINLVDLDQKLWTALSCPVYGLEIDSKTLELIDVDNDDRIRVPEVIAAVKWLTSLMKDPDELVKVNKSLKLSSINDSTEVGRTLLESARQILTNLGKPDADSLSVEETSDTVKIFAETKFNGDGIITENSADDEGIKKLIADIISCEGSVTDRSGKEGISISHINDFYQNCTDYSNWYARAESEKNKVLPFGDDTSKAYAALLAVKGKIEDYFLRCRLSEYDPGSTEVLNPLKSGYESITAKDLSACLDEIASFPLSAIDPERTLAFSKAINPAWEKPMETFKALVVHPLFPGKESMNEKELDTICSKFDDYIAWQSEKKGASVEKLGLPVIREINSGNSKEKLYSLIDQDKALESNANNIFLVDKLVRYYRDLFRLLRNYVTFYDFYSPDEESIFQAGKLYFDQRCCELCMIVRDMGKHNALARTSGLFLAYCECTLKRGNEKMLVVAAFTDGDFDNIDVGRNGIFYDRQGRDWDATIVKILDNPISIRQAFWSPYRKVSKFINNAGEKFASDKEKEVDTVTQTGVEKTAGKVDTGLKESVQSASATAATPPAPFDIGKFVGIFAALSLALGAIGSVLMSVFTGFFSLTWWKMPLALLGVMLFISGPSMLLAWLKLRKRNLAPLLDANGWAVNARATINIAFGATLTHLARLPVNSKLNLVDPFAKKRNPWIPVLLIITVLAAGVLMLWHFGLLSRWGVF